ncbi:hypothetical protein [Streptomyces misionensis]|uniref:hypothetical protein n=2 Tax=Streptomyces TaxID=1883 RepID=UPI0033B3DB28
MSISSSNTWKSDHVLPGHARAPFRPHSPVVAGLKRVQLRVETTAPQQCDAAQAERSAADGGTTLLVSHRFSTAGMADLIVMTLEKGVFRLGVKGGGRFVQIPLKRPVPHEHAAERSFPPLAAGEFRPVRLAPAKPG